MTAEPEQQPMTRVVSVGAAPAVSPLMAGLLGALGRGYRGGDFDDADVILVPATTAVTVEGAAAVARLRQARPSVGIIAVTTGAPISPPAAVIALDAGADAVVRVQTPAELAAHVYSVARRINGLGGGAVSAGVARPGAAGAAAARAAAGQTRRASSATAARPRRQHGKRTRIAAAIVSGGTALGLAGAMAAHAAAQSAGSTTTVANAGSSDDGSLAPPPQSQSQSQDDSEGTSSVGSTGRFSGGTTNAIPTRPHTRTRGS